MEGEKTGGGEEREKILFAVRSCTFKGAPLVVVAISVGTSYDYYGVRDSDGSLRL